MSDGLSAIGDGLKPGPSPGGNPESTNPHLSRLSGQANGLASAAISR
jgi:hypothetical protein